MLADGYDMKKKLHKLHEQDTPFEVVAIVCPESHLKMSWLLNNSLGFELKEWTGVDINHKSENPLHVPSHRDENLMITLIKNRYEGVILIKSLPNVDFLLKIDGSRTSAEIKKIIKDIKSIPGVLGAILLDTKSMKELQILKSA